MRKKRIISGLLCLSMLLTSMPYAAADVSAADSSETSEEQSKETKELEKAIREVKKRVDIPKELNEFDYDVSNSYSISVFTLTWTRMGEGEYSNGDKYTYVAEKIRVVYNSASRLITSYQYTDYEDNDEKPAFEKLSLSEQEEAAKKYFRQLNPNLNGDPVIERSSGDYSLRDHTAEYSVSRSEYDIGLKGNGGNITVDTDTGELLEFRLTWWNDAEFPDATKRLSEKQVMDIYASRKPLKAEYEFFEKWIYDEEKEKYVYEYFTLPVYFSTVTGQNEIDAITGEYTSLYKDKDKYSYTDEYYWDDDYEYGEEVDLGEGLDGPDYLSDEEAAALEAENKYMSYEKLREIIKKDEFIVFEDKLISSGNYFGGYYDENMELKDSRVLEFEYSSQKDTEDTVYLDVKFDAYTGKVISFDKRRYYGKNSPNLPKKPPVRSEVISKASAAAKHFLGDKAKEYKITNVSDIDEKDTMAYVTMTRYVNGLPTAFDYINIYVDSYGEVMSFDYTYHNVDFPDANLVGEKAAYDKLFEKMKPSLYYTGFTDLQQKSHIYLTYRFDASYQMNALTGERINNDGMAYYKEAEPAKEKPEQKLYTDIKGHKYEKEITKLFDYGVRITKDEKLNPDDIITVGEFQELYDRIIGHYIYEKYIYVDDKETGEKKRIPNPYLEKKLTRKRLAEIYVDLYTDLSEAAEIKGIYISPYSDIPSDDSSCGYIAIAKARGLIPEMEEFKPNMGFSKGACLKIAYDYFNSDGEEKDLTELFESFFK